METAKLQYISQVISPDKTCRSLLRTGSAWVACADFLLRVRELQLSGHEINVIPVLKASAKYHQILFVYAFATRPDGVACRLSVETKAVAEVDNKYIRSKTHHIYLTEAYIKPLQRFAGFLAKYKAEDTRGLQQLLNFAVRFEKHPMWIEYMRPESPGGRDFKK